jgi:histidine triad (HIT) family protein
LSCIFCSIVEGKAPSVKLYEDDKTLSFLDIRPLVPGHALVVPKVHCLDLRDCPAEYFGPILSTSQRVAPALLAATGADDFNIIVANGKCAGQEVFHLHFHLFPRKSGDGFTRTSLTEHVGKAKVVAHAQLESLGAKVRAALEAQMTKGGN